jgi:hypothetical protein
MSADLEMERQVHEAKLLSEMIVDTEPNYKEIESTWLSWFNLRLKDMQSKQGYLALNEGEKLLLLEELKREISKELNLDSSRDEITGEEMMKIKKHNEKPHYDISNKNNLAEISTNSVGYQNIDKRLADPSKQYESAHENLFE